MVTTNELIAASRVDGRDEKDRQREVLDMAIAIVAGSIRCVACNNRPMKLGPTTKVSDQWRWPCTKCKKVRSVRADAFFKDAKVSVPNWLRFIVEWSRHPHATNQQLRASTVPAITEMTVGGMSVSISDMCDRLAYEWEYEKLGF